MIELLFFAQLQEETGTDKMTIDAAGMTIREIKETFLATYDMDELLDQAMVAVNEEYSREDVVVQAGDIVAFIPPVSGG